MRRTMIMGVLAGLALASPAAAQWGQQNDPYWSNGGGWQQAGWDDRRWGNDRRWDDRRGNGGWDDGRYCRRSDGGTGTVLGAVVGGVVGNQVVKGNDRTVATVAGAVVGGLLGRSIDRGRVVCR